MPAVADVSLRERILSLNKDIEDAFIEALGIERKITTLRNLEATDEADAKLEGYMAALIKLSNLQRERHQCEEEWAENRWRALRGEMKAIRIGARRS